MTAEFWAFTGILAAVSLLFISGLIIVSNTYIAGMKIAGKYHDLLDDIRIAMLERRRDKIGMRVVVLEDTLEEHL